MDAGDGPKDSGTEAFNKSNGQIGRRKLIVTDQDTQNSKSRNIITEDYYGNLYGSDGNKLIYVPGM